MHTEPQEESGRAAPSAPHPPVLVVEEDHELRTAVRDVLVDEGFEVVEALSFEHGAETLRGLGRACVVVIDHPRTVEAIAACCDLLQEAQGSSPLVWLASTKPQQALADPRVPVVMMPFSTAEIAEAVDEAMLCLGGRRR